jgi:hypothetical protein
MDSYFSSQQPGHANKLRAKNLETEKKGTSFIG